MPPSAAWWEHSPHDGTVGAGPAGYPTSVSEPLQNDPDRAGGLVSDAQGEFVEEDPGGPFDPRTFRDGDGDGDGGGGGGGGSGGGGGGRTTGADPEPEPGAGAPPVDDERMSSPGQEDDKTG